MENFKSKQAKFGIVSEMKNACFSNESALFLPQPKLVNTYDECKVGFAIFLPVPASRTPHKVVMIN